MTLVEIRQTGIELLSQHLGMTGMIRFFQQAEKGTGDYTQERKQWLNNSSVRNLAEEIIKQWRRQQQ